MTLLQMGSLVTLSLDAPANTMKALIRLPKMSPMTTQLLGRLARRDCDLRELTALIEKDALLSARLLQMANSAAYARLQHIHSLKHAISLIGLSALRKFAVAISLSNLFSKFKAADSFSLSRFNAHSVATGVMTELLADHLPVESKEDVFLAGMLHDVGKLLIAVNLPKQYDDILAVVAVRRVSLIEAEREVMGFDHAELSAEAIVRWELAEPICRAARFHHEPDYDPHAVANGRLGLSLLVHTADALVNDRGLSVLPASKTFDDPDVIEVEGRTVKAAPILARFDKEWQILGSLFR